MGDQLKCTFGAAPAPITVIPKGMPVMFEGKFAATMTDNIPIANIAPFGMCSSLSNPQVAAATAAASGVLTPMPCIPVTPAPWAPPSPTVNIGGINVINASSMLNCIWGGVITPTPTASKEQVP